MAMTNTDTPKLRFPEFAGAWEPVILGDVATFSKGKGISKAEISQTGKTPCVRYGELYTDYGAIIDKPVSYTDIPVSELYISEGNEVIVPASGEDPKDIATAAVVLRKGVALGGDLNIIRSKQDGLFLASYLSGKKRMTLASMAQGYSVVHLYPTQLQSLELSLPSLPEQRKISAFLSSLDRKIGQLVEKKALLEKYKNGCMQELFSQNIRFKADDKNDFPKWINEKLGDVTSTFSGGTPSVSNPKFYDGNIPFIKSGEISAPYAEQTISEYGLKNSSAKMVMVGDLLYALYGATAGEAALSKINGAINQAVLCIRTNQEIKYLYQYLIFRKDIIRSTYLQGGQGNLSGEIVKKLIIPLPCIKEQRKIAEFLSAIDTKISLVTDELNGVKVFKKGLLQQMFI